MAFRVSEIQEMPELNSQVRSDYIQGVYKKDDGLTVLLDLARCLDVKDYDVLKSLKQAA